MDWTWLTDLARNLETERVVATLQNWKLEKIVQDPRFLGGVAVLALIAFFMRWRIFLSIILGLAGFAALLSFTLRQGTEIEGLGSQPLLIFVGGGVLVIGLVIYLLFIKSD